MRIRRFGVCAIGLSLVSLLVAPSSVHASPVRSTNGRIVFERVKRRSGSLYSSDPNGSNVVRIVHSDGVFFYSAAWSPDGKRLVYARAATRSRRSTLVVSRADGTGRRTIYSFHPRSLGSTRQILDADWSPDGGTIAFSIGNFRDRGETFLIHPNGKGFRRLASDFPGPQFDPSWSPNGKHIALEVPQFQGNTYLGARIGILNLATQHMRKGPPGFSPDWSVDGRIYFASGGHLYRMNSDGSGRTRLQHARKAYQPASSPDGRAVAYQGADDIYVLDLATGTTTPVTNTRATEFQPAWQPVP